MPFLPIGFVGLPSQYISSTQKVSKTQNGGHNTRFPILLVFKAYMMFAWGSGLYDAQNKIVHTKIEIS
jgi:hypothetical protein